MITKQLTQHDTLASPPSLSHLELTWTFFDQLELKLVSGAFQLADALRRPSERLLQLVELLLLLLLQSLLYAFLLFEKELSQTTKFCRHHLVQVSRSPLRHRKDSRIQLKTFNWFFSSAVETLGKILLCFTLFILVKYFCEVCSRQTSKQVALLLN